MSDYHIGVSEDESAAPSPPPDKEPGTEPVNRISNIVGKWLEHSDAIIHGVIGISFLLAALLALVYSFWDIGILMIERTASEPASLSLVALV